MTSRNPRDTGRWKELRAKLIREAERCAEPCSICGAAIDYDAPARSKYSASIDHIHPLKRGGAPYARANLRLTHYGCNASRGAGRTSRAPLNPPVMASAEAAPDMADCNAVWTGARADPHAWMGCSTPNCPREVAARIRAEGLVLSARIPAERRAW
jgi:hypothetical protein